VGVIVQGVLGGMRVLFDERTLAMIHGCVGSAFFAFTAALAVVTSRRWRESAKSVDLGTSGALPAMAVITPGLAYLQLAIGAHLRHFAPEGAPATFHLFVWSHVGVALVLALQIFATAILFWRKTPHAKPLVATSAVLAALVLLQMALGASTWLFKYGVPAFLADTDAASSFTVQANSWRQTQITTAHVAMGSLILAVSTALAVLSVRMIQSQPRAVTHGNGAANNSLSGMTA
jgi:cytochrome c oxidase assembly protein subunit 15